MSEQPTDQQPDIMNVEGSNGAVLTVDKNRLGLEGLSEEEKKGRVLPLSKFMLGHDLADEDLQRLQEMGATVGVRNEDGSIDQGTMIGGGLAVEEHIPPQH